MNFLELGLYIITVVAMIASPGPVMILVASTGLNQGYRAAFKTIVGTNLASLILITISILALKGIFAIDEKIYVIIRIVGCLYIGYLGVEILKEYFIDKEGDVLKPLSTTAGGFKKGLLIGLSNPKDIIFFASFFPQFIGVHADINISLTILIVTWVILDFLTLTAIYKAFNSLSKSKIYPVIMIICGILFLGIAVYGLYVAIDYFM